jgi:endonuclease YncB( thermonuclease family)
MWRSLLLAGALCAAPSLAVASDGWPTPPTESTVKSVYDGDTFTLATGDKVRLKGVNTPELRPREDYGDEARQFAERFLSGETVQLLLDGPNPRDSYGRVVAGVRTSAGDLSVALVEQGLAHVFLIPPDSSDAEALLAAQARARQQRLGIWSTEPYQGALHMTSFHANAAGDDNENVNGEYMRVCNITTGPVSTEGYRLVDRTGLSYPLPAVTIPAGHTVQVRSGKGEQQTDPSQQLQIYLGSSTPLWNNDYEVVTLHDPQGRRIDQRVQGKP